MTDQLRLLVAALDAPTLKEVGELFQSEAQPATELAYLLATALVNDLRERHGSDLPGRIARRVAAGVMFPQAFSLETGETPDAAAALAWRSYRTWSRWVPAVFSAAGTWSLIIVLAALAFLARKRRRARRRARWDEEEGRT